MMGGKQYFVTVEGAVSDVYRVTAANEVYASRDAQAQFHLALMYASGKGVPRNFVTGYHWLSVSNAQGYKPAELYMSSLTTKMTAAQIAQYQKGAAEFLEVEASP